MAAVPASLVKDLRERTGLGMMECKKALVKAGADIDLAIENLRKSSGMKAAKKAGRVAAEGVVATRVSGESATIVEINSETDFAARDDGFLAFVNRVADAAASSRAETVEDLMAGELEAARETLIQKTGENISVRRFERVGTGGVTGGVVASYVHGNQRIAVLVALSAGTEELARDVAMHVAAVNPRVVKPEDMPREAIDREKEIFSAQAAASGKPAEIIEKMVVGRMRKFLAENSLTEQPFVKDPDVTVGRLVSQGGGEINGFVRYEVGEGIEKAEEDFATEVAKQVESAGA